MRPNIFARSRRQYGTDHQEFDLNPEAGLQDAIEEFAYYSDEPSADAGALPVWFLSKLSKQHATVMLSGEGGDELFGGYLTYRANHAGERVRGAAGGVATGDARARSAWPVSDDKISFEYKVKRFLDGCLMPPERAHVFWNGTFTDAEKAAGWFCCEPRCDATASSTNCASSSLSAEDRTDRARICGSIRNTFCPTIF